MAKIKKDLNGTGKKILSDAITMDPIETPTVNAAVDKVLQLFDQHIRTVRLIADDYLADVGMLTEMQAAEEKLFELIEDLRIDSAEDKKEKELSFSDIMDQLKENIRFDREKATELLELIDDDDPEPIHDFVRSKGFVYIKVENIDQQMKLEDFVNREIWSDYNQQISNVLI
jgi:hypothetical protein